MKKVRNLLSVLMMSIIISTSTIACAYAGTVDIDDNIQISKINTNGNTSINITRDVQNYKLQYQWVEIDNNLYNQIKKLKEELTIIQYFRIYEADQTDDNYNVYLSAQEFYKNQYGDYLYDGSDTKINENISIINSLLPEQTGSWVDCNNNTASIDLTQFTGTKNYVLWVAVEKNDGTKVYDAEIYELTGTGNTPAPTPGTDESETPVALLDPYDNIIISDIIANGKGTIKITRDVPEYTLYYQWVGIDQDLYNQIRKLKDQLAIIGYFNIYEMEQTDFNYDTYRSAQEFYKNKYGEYFMTLTNEQANENISIINNLLLNKGYRENWTQTTDNTFSTDGINTNETQYYILWAKLVKPDGRIAYDGEIFEFEKTKDEEKKDEEKKDDEKKEDDKKPDDSKKDDEKKQDDSKKDESSTEQKEEKIIPTTTATGTIPHTGLGSNIILGIIPVLVAGSAYSFIRYRKIK